MVNVYEIVVMCTHNLVEFVHGACNHKSGQTCLNVAGSNLMVAKDDDQ